MSVSELPRVVDAAWLAAHLDEDDLVVGDVRGPNAHTRGHIPGSRPLVLGSPPPGADDAAVAELAKEVALRLRRHGLNGAERLAKELSYALASVVVSIGVEQGAVVRYNLYDRGADVDEYLSLPEYYGELPPGDVIALGANPTLVARLTGADPLRVREVARTAASPSELPPASDLYAQIAELMGVTV